MLRMRTFVRGFEYGLVAGLTAMFEKVASFFAKLEHNLIEEKKRDEVRSLLWLDDHQLRDMGISRDDVKAALMQPLDKNSGRILTNARKRVTRI